MIASTFLIGEMKSALSPHFSRSSLEMGFSAATSFALEVKDGGTELGCKCRQLYTSMQIGGRKGEQHSKVDITSHTHHKLEDCTTFSYLQMVSTSDSAQYISFRRE